MRKIFFNLVLVFIFFNLILCYVSCTEPVFPEVASESLVLSHNPGVYKTPFALGVSKKSEDNTIYYTIDGSPATVNSAKYDSRMGISVHSSIYAQDYPITKAVKVYDEFVYGTYNYGYLGTATVINLLETDKNGKELAKKSCTFIIHPDGEDHFDFPVISIYGSPKEVINMYNDINDEPKIRMNFDYMDFVNDEFFSLNTQAKLGGNWTKGFAVRTINLNFNKDQNGNKNAKPQADIFDGRLAGDGSGDTIKGKVTRFRLHSGGNDTFGALITDAFVHRLCHQNVEVATTAYRPCILYINGEYWGLYNMREHYSDVYFEYNYCVNKDDVIYLDKAHNATGKYFFDVQEGDEEVAVAELDKLYDFLEYDEQTGKLKENACKDWTSDEVYDEFCQMVDVTSLIDLVLIHGYVGNWDFMSNNFRMWKTVKKVEDNKFTDGKWRFILHDADFSFEDATADNGIIESQQWKKGGGKSYLDFYLGNASVYINNLNYLPPVHHLILSLPAKNPKFKELVLQRAKIVEQIFAPDVALDVFDQMASDISSCIKERVQRWGKNGYNYNVWQSICNSRCNVIKERPKTFMAQVKSAFGISSN